MRKSFTQLFSVFTLICVLGFQASTFAQTHWDADKSVPADDAPNVNPADIATQFVVAFDGAPTIADGTMSVYEGSTLIKTIPINSSSSDVVVSGNTIEVTHGIASFDEETAYSLALSAGAVTVSGSGVPISGWDFMTGDFTAPTLGDKEPTGDDVEATILENPFELVLTFDEDVVKGEGNIAIYEDGGTVVELVDVASEAVTIDGNEVTVAVSGDARFIPQTLYYVRVAPGAFTDDVSDYSTEDAEAMPNEYVGITDNTTWTFTTRDNSAPAITAEVSDITKTSANLTVSIDEDGAFYYLVQEKSEDAPTVIGDFTGPVSATAGVAKVIALTLDHTTEYEVYVVSENDEDPANRSSLTGKRLTFETVDGTNPVLRAFRPNNGSSDQYYTNELGQTNKATMFFTEKVTAGVGTLSLRKVENNELIFSAAAADLEYETSKVGGSSSLKNTYRVNVYFDEPLESGVDYYIVFPNGFIVDLFGNPFENPVVAYKPVPVNNDDWTFTSRDFVAPEVTFSTETKSTETTSVITGAGNNDEIYIHFDENVELANGNEWPSSGDQSEWTKYVTITKDGINVAADFEVDSDLDDPTTTITIDPDEALESNTTYVVTLRAGVVEDANGNVVEAAQTVSITAGDNDDPSYEFSPSDDLAEMTPLTITFSKDVFVDGTTPSALETADLEDIVKVEIDGVDKTADFDLVYDPATLTITATPTVAYPTTVCGVTTTEVVFYFDKSDLVDSKGGSFVGGVDFSRNVVDYKAPVATLITGEKQISSITGGELTITFDEAVTLLDSYVDGEELADQIMFKMGSASGVNLDFTAAIDLTNKIITITPDVALAVGKTYYYGIGSSMEDCAGNANVATNGTVTVIADYTPPVVSALTYTVNGGDAIDIDDAAEGVKVNSGGDIVVKVTFDTAIDDANLTNAVITDFSSGNVTIVSDDIDGSMLTITIPNPVIPEPITTYTVTIPAGLVESNATYNGTDFAQLEDPVNITIKTADMLAPVITGTVPADLAPDVEVDFGTLKVTFDEKVILGSGTITFNDGADEQVITVNASNVNIASDGMSADVDVDLLDDYNTTYTVTIAEGVFTDKAGNKTAEEVFSFTTEVNPQPVVVTDGLSPADNSDEVSLEISLTMEFSEEVDQAGEIGTRKLIYVVEHTGSGARAAFDTELNLVANDDNIVYSEYVELDKVTISGNMVTASDVTLAANKNYYVMITPGAFIDKSTGNESLPANPVPGEYAGITDHTTWSFTTSNVNAPEVELEFTSFGADDLVATDSDIKVVFSKPIVHADGTEIEDVEIANLFTLTKDPSLVDPPTIEFTGTISADKKTVTIDNSSLVTVGELVGSTEYEVSFEAGVFKVEDASINLGAWNGTFMTSDYDAPEAPSFDYTVNEETSVYYSGGKHVAKLTLSDESEGDAVEFYHYWTNDPTAELTAQQVMDMGTKVTSAPKNLTFNTGMDSETQYMVVAIGVDAAGNMSSVAEFVYTTDDVVDPELAEALPTTLGTDDAFNLVFAEDVVPVVDAYARIYDANGVMYEAPLANLSGPSSAANIITIVIDAAGLPIANDVATYTVEVDPGMIVDVPRLTEDDTDANTPNEYAGILGSTFSVVSDDEVDPTLEDVTPFDEAVSLNPTFTLTFSEDVDLNSTFTQFVVYEGVGGPTALKSAPIGGPYDILTADNISIAGHVVTITTNRALVSGNSYYLEIIDQTFSDMTGNKWINEGDLIIPFKGEDTIGLLATFYAESTELPASSDLTTIPVDLYIDFDEDFFINPNDPIVSAYDLMSHVYVKKGETPVDFDVIVSDVDEINLVLDLSAADKGATFTFGYENLYDAYGNLTAGESVSFTIAPDAEPVPWPLTFDPTDGHDEGGNDFKTEIGIDVDQVFTVTFEGIIYSWDSDPLLSNLIVDADWLLDNNVFELKETWASVYPEITLTYEVVDGNSVVTIQSVDPLESETDYRLRVNPDGNIQVGQGNSIPIETNTYKEYYTTSDVVDPTLAMDGDEISEYAYKPNGSNGGIVTIEDKIGLKFSEPVEGAGVVEIHRWDGALVAEVDVTGMTSNTYNIVYILDLGDIADYPDFVTDENYYVIVPAGAFEDQSGNPFAGILEINEWSFEFQDDNAPEVTFADNGMDNIPVNTTIDLLFDREVVFNPGEKGWLAIYEEEDGDAVQLIRINNDVAEIDPAEAYDFVIDPLMPSTKYYVELGGGAFVLAADGVTETNQVEIGEWWFTTETNDAPMVVSYQPEHESTVVPVTDLVITFDMDVAPGVGNIQLHNGNEVGDNIIATFDVTDPAKVMFDGATVTIPADVLGLVENSNYYVIIPGSAIMNTSSTPEYFAGVTVPNEWKFSTTLDGTAPTLLTWTPNAETIADNHPTFVMTFDEEVMLSELGGNLVVTRKDSVNPTLTIPLTEEMIDGTTVTVTYVYDETIGGLDKDAEYFVTVDGGALKDATGNLFTGVADVTAWTFTTGDFVTDTPELDQVSYLVYPNPFDRFVKVDNASQLSRIVISNVAGQRVKDIVNPSDRITTSEFRSGIYFITLVKDDVVVKTERIVKR